MGFASLTSKNAGTLRVIADTTKNLLCEVGELGYGRGLQ